MKSTIVKWILNLFVGISLTFGLAYANLWAVG